MKRSVIALIILLVLAGAMGGGWWYVNKHPEWWFWAQEEVGKRAARLGLGSEEEPSNLVVSGFIEADEATVAAELGGRIVALYADEGDEVVQGQLLVRLDDSLLLAQIEQAKAEVAVAQANLARVKAGARQETLDHALALLKQARVAEEAARVAWEDAQAMRDHPQDLELAIIAAQTQLQVLDLQQQQAQALANAAQTGRDFADEMVSLLQEFEPYDEWVLLGSFDLGTLPPEIPLPPGLGDGEYLIGRYKIVIDDGTITVYVKVHIKPSSAALPTARYQQAIATYQSWAAWTGLDQAQAARNGAHSYLAQLQQQKANPLALQAQVNAARSQVEIAQANVALAQAQVDGLRMGATPQQIAAVESQVKMAQAALSALEVQASRFSLTAPISGLVLERPVHVGEVARPGSPLLTLADLDHLTLTLYVPENRLGQVYIGQPVQVTVDAYPGRTFTGTVSFISGQAEFTPRNVQTREERVNMVFAVRVRLSNADHALKPGMPADAVLEIGERR